MSRTTDLSEKTTLVTTYDQFLKLPLKDSTKAHTIFVQQGDYYHIKKSKHYNEGQIFHKSQLTQMIKFSQQ